MIEKSENKGGCKHSGFSLRDGILVCSVCGRPSTSPKWKANTYGLVEAESMQKEEEGIRKMSEKEKSALIAPVLDPKDPTLLQWGAKLTYAQRLVISEKGIGKPEDLPENTMDAGAIREQAPEDLKTALAKAKAKLDKAESLLQAAQELQWKTLDRHRKLGSTVSELAFFQGVPAEMVDRYDKAKNKHQVAEELVKEAARACEAPRLEYNSAAAALDHWVRLEQARRHLLARQRDEASLAPMKEPSSLEERIAQVQRDA